MWPRPTPEGGLEAGALSWAVWAEGGGTSTESESSAWLDPTLGGGTGAADGKYLSPDEVGRATHAPSCEGSWPEVWMPSCEAARCTEAFDAERAIEADRIEAPPAVAFCSWVAAWGTMADEPAEGSWLLSSCSEIEREGASARWSVLEGRLLSASSLDVASDERRFYFGSAVFVGFHTINNTFN